MDKKTPIPSNEELADRLVRILSVEPVETIVGPGNSWVTAAKLAVYGVCSIDLPAGPSAVLVLADHTADPEIVAGYHLEYSSMKFALFFMAEYCHMVVGAAMISDAFFPFRDGIDTAAEAGVTAVIQPGGSMRDGEVIAAADEHDMAMMFTGIRHFRH